jgi:steroid 5-alpha reductase family enzyme
VLDVVIALGLSITLVAVILAALLDPEPATKLALAGLSVAMIAIVLEKFGLQQPKPPTQA